jgi:hypothetical protein
MYIPLYIRYFPFSRHIPRIWSMLFTVLFWFYVFFLDIPLFRPRDTHLAVEPTWWLALDWCSQA